MTRLTRRNHGLITASGLRRLGYSEREVRGLVGHGDLRRVHRGVYADGRMPLSDQGRLHAARLALGGSAWIACTAAAATWSLTHGVPAMIDISVVAARTPRHQGLRITRVSHPPHPSEIRTRNGLRVSSIPRLLIETAAAGATTDQIHRLIEHAVRQNRLDIADLAATLKRHARHAGTRLVHRTCQEYLPHLDRKSALERAFDRWLTRHPEIPPPERNIKLGFWEIDCYWPESRLALELDGRPYHTMVEDIERDHRKDAWLQAQAHLILRVTDSRFRRDRPGVHRDLTAMLARGAGQPR